MKKQHIGSNFDDFLPKEQLLDVATATAEAGHCVPDHPKEMKRRKLIKSEMASRMKTSRAALEKTAEYTGRLV